MRRAIAVAARGSWPVARTAGTATLRHDDRHRRRLKLATDTGEPFLLDLPRPTRLADGDGLELDDGAYVLVRAATEDCVLVRCADAATTARIAWHLGNRHLPVQITPDGLLIRADHVIVDMVRGLGAIVEARRCAFDPEAGAYAEGGGPHHHDHDDDNHHHEHEHGHVHSHAHGHRHD
jgi:urease accessory protein